MDYIKFDKKPNLFRVDVSLEIDEIIEKEEEGNDEVKQVSSVKPSLITCQRFKIQIDQNKS